MTLAGPTKSGSGVKVAVTLDAPARCTKSDKVPPTTVRSSSSTKLSPGFSLKLKLTSAVALRPATRVGSPVMLSSVGATWSMRRLIAPTLLPGLPAASVHPGVLMSSTIAPLASALAGGVKVMVRVSPSPVTLM